MVLDEPRDTDDVFEVSGFTYLVDKELIKRAEEINVDFVTHGTASGFTVTSQLALSKGCGTCSC